MNEARWLQLNEKENRADFSSLYHRCSVHWFHIWVTVSLDDWAIAHLWEPPLLIWPRATGNRIKPGNLLAPLYDGVSSAATLPTKFICMFDGNRAAAAQGSLLFPSGGYGSICCINGSNCVDLFMLWVFSASQADKQDPDLSASTRTSSTAPWGTSLENTYCKWTACSN